MFFLDLREIEGTYVYVDWLIKGENHACRAHVHIVYVRIEAGLE